MHFILFVLIGLIAGALAGRVVSGHGYGLLGDLIVGVVGAFLGGWLFAVAFGVVGGGLFVSLLTAFVGAVILLWVIRLLRRARLGSGRESPPTALTTSAGGARRSTQPGWNIRRRVRPGPGGSERRGGAVQGAARDELRSRSDL